MAAASAREEAPSKFLALRWIPKLVSLHTVSGTPSGPRNWTR